MEISYKIAYKIAYPYPSRYPDAGNLSFPVPLPPIPNDSTMTCPHHSYIPVVQAIYTHICVQLFTIICFTIMSYNMFLQ